MRCAARGTLVRRALPSSLGEPCRGHWANPRTLGSRQLAYEVTRLLLELEDDQLRERSDYNEAAQAEAERAGDTDTIERLLLERRQINEARRSLDRRREDTRLFARPTVAVHS